MARLTLGVLLIAAVAPLGGPSLAAQADSAAHAGADLRSSESLLQEAERWAESGDTTLAIALLRRVVAENPAHPDAVFALGTLLARTAPTEEADFTQRAEAEDLLERAWDLQHGDPNVLVEMGLLKRKQNIRIDSRRVLEDALDPDREERLDPRIAADAHFTIAEVLEDELFDFEHMVFLPNSRREFGDGSGTFCPAGVEFFCNNYTRTRDFNLLFEEVASPASDRAEEYYPRIEDHYRTALSYRPDHELAARGLMAVYLRLGRLDDFEGLATELVELNPRRPYPRLFLGLALYHAERWEAAKAVFDEGLALLPAEERVAFQDVRALLQRTQRRNYNALAHQARRDYEDVLWAKSDPLYLIPGNERWMEHVARVAYAELNFGDPALGHRGWESDRGLVYIRWGPPRKIWKINTNSRLGTGTGGRWLLWNYRLDAPSFIFWSTAGYESVRFDPSANTEAYATELAETESASVFRSRAVTTWIDLPYQIARFKGSGPDLTQVVGWVEADPARFLLFEGDSVTAALMLFTPLRRDTVELRRTVSAGNSGNLAFTLEAYPADYEYAIEGLARESRVAGTERGELPILGFPEDQLSLSDLVVADGVVPRIPEPVRWSDFSIGVSRDLSFAPDEEIHLYFELYGLTTDGNGEARYELEITVQDVTEEGLVSSVVRSLGDLVGLGDDEDTRIRFDRSAQPREGIVPEYLSLTLADVEPGSYVIHVLVRDDGSDQEREIVREITIEG